MNDITKMLYNQDELAPNINRTVRDDITLYAVQSALFINTNKSSIKKRSFKVNTDTRIIKDGFHLTSEYMESFVDAMATVYSDNVEKINRYSFKVTCTNEKRSLPEEARALMHFCQDRAAECGIADDKISFGLATASTSEDYKSCISVTVYAAPFAISKQGNMQISTWNKMRLFIKALYGIVTGK